MTSVFTDNFYHTFSGEVYTKSQCLIHEHSTAQLFYSMLINLGYRSTDPNRRVWKNNEKVVVVCLSDDFTFSRTVKSKSLDNCFDTDTVVITDNYTYFNPQYTVLRLPDSYFGIFHYVPSLTEFQPDKRFNFSVNRIDKTRELILLELINQSGGVESWLSLDHANFNCFDPSGANQSVDDIKTNFLKFDKLNLSFGLVLCSESIFLRLFYKDVTFYFPFEAIAIVLMLFSLKKIEFRWSMAR